MGFRRRWKNMATMLCFQVRSPIVCARFLTPNVASLQVKRKSLEQANISAQPQVDARRAQRQRPKRGKTMSEPQAPVVASNVLLAEDLLRIAESFENARGWLYRAHFFAVRSSLRKTPNEIADTIRDLEKAEKQLRDFTANPTGQGMTQKTGKKV